MTENMLARFAPMLREIADADLAAEIEQPSRLLMEEESAGGKRVEIAYAPFDYVNPDAKIVIVGLTPGRQQMRNALIEARRTLRIGKSLNEVSKSAKMFASFSGPMRANLVAMLDSIGVNRLLGLPTAGTLWDLDSQLAHFTSALRYPVFVAGANFSGTPSMVTTPILRRHLLKWLADEMALLPGAIYVPLGPKVTEAVELVACHLGMANGRILSGMPHPSGANAERIAFFLGRKSREKLSAKVDPDRLSAARDDLEAKVSAMSDLDIRVA